MNITTLRLRYAQFFVICLVCISLYAMSQSLAGGISEFDNNFWQHKFLIGSFTKLKLDLGDRVFPQNLVGKDGWLEYTNEEALDYHQNSVAIPEEKVKYTQQIVRELYDELQKRNIVLVLMIAPDKATIYPDKLPDEIHLGNTESKLDAFSAYIDQHGPPVWVNLTPPLLNERKKHDVYYKTDTHWNPYGAFVAYTELINKLAQTYPQLTPLSINDFIITTSSPVVLDTAGVMGATSLVEPKITFKKKKTKAIGATPTPSGKPLKLLLYRDSFGRRTQKLISYNFKKAVFLPNHSRPSLKQIEQIKPDIVVIEFVERYFNAGRFDDFISTLLTALNKQ